MHKRSIDGSVPRACPGCHSDLKKRFTCSGGFEVHWCSVCGIGVTVPFPDDAYLDALYATGAFRANDGNRFIPLVEHIIAFFRNLHRRRITGRIGKGRILDIGCGRGTFLASMRSAGWDVHGVEYSEETASYARTQYGIPVSTKLSSIEGPFDVVTLNHVIEHIQDPTGLLSNCRRLLREGGVLVVAAPNIESLQAKFGGARWFHLDVPHHLHHFSERSLISLINAAGFEVERIRRFDFEHNPFGWIQTILNRFGFRHNALYEFLKKPGLRKSSLTAPVTAAMTLALVPVMACGYFLAIVEAAIGASGTVEVRASIKAPISTSDISR